jgi:NADH-quinone oxidoreductase subunit C
MMLDYSAEKIEKIKARYGDAIEEVVTERTDVPIFFVKKEKIVEFLASIRTEEGLEYNFLADLTAYDDNPPVADIPDYGLGVVKPGGGEHRFVVVYQLFSFQHKDRIRIKLRAREGEAVPSVTSVWKAATCSTSAGWATPSEKTIPSSATSAFKARSLSRASAWRINAK